ncbi:MFS transporter [Caenimonas aquaedulcis]|uniref:MFS transporter n=1 Tax=Caenimonas aquaedulcis TaxID=2793270 RepID=A0A931H8U6_9BURK|nr:MFS transporter [Caenimonas aquaedulcis]MBG9390673.1 MFS transporter [Caenimonas aquaedulcis]
MWNRTRIIPLVVACPMFLQNLDTSVMGTALPAIADSLDADVLHLNLAITSYLLSLVLFLPASAWLAERYGPRRVFCTAVFLFSLASALCGAATTLGQLIFFRLLQGVGGAMMVPVGRLILLRAVPVAQMVVAMVWFTVPGGIGRLMGPLVGGAIVTVMSWRWIFLVNIPFGLAGVLLALYFIDKDLPPDSDAEMAPFDVPGLLLMAAALGGLLGALEMAGKSLMPWPGVVALACVGCASLWLYLRRSNAQAVPLVDFKVFRFLTFRASVAGGAPVRVAIGASPFLLPLLFQVGFGMTPLQAGTITMATALGSLGIRGAVTRAVKTFGYRRMLILSSATTSLFYAAYTFFTPETPHALLFVVLLFAGMSNAMTLVVLATIGYNEIPRNRMGHATALGTMAQQVSVAFGVTLAASLVELAHYFHGGAPGVLAAADFRPALIAVAMLPFMSAIAFLRLPKNTALADDET